MLALFSFLAVLTNVGILIFRTDFVYVISNIFGVDIETGDAHTTDPWKIIAHKWLCFLLTSGVICLGYFLIKFIVPDVPEKIERAMKRQV